MPFGEIEYLKIYRRFMDLSRRIEEISEKENLCLIDLRELLELTEEGADLAKKLIDASAIEDMFIRDAKRIKDAYLKNQLSKSLAQEALQNLEECAEKLPQRTQEIRRKFHEVKFILMKLEANFQEVQKTCRLVINELEEIHKLSYPPKYGIPVDTIIEEIKRGIKDILGPKGELPKKEFGILQLSKKEEGLEEKLTEFLEEYSSGIIVISEPHLKDKVLGVLERYSGLQIEEKEIGNKYLLILQCNI